MKKTRSSPRTKSLTARQVANKVAAFEQRREKALQRIDALHRELRKVDGDLREFLGSVPECV